MSQSPSNDKSPHVAATSFAHGEPRDLFARTLRTIAVLVGSCVLFVGVLSVSAVAITNRALGSHVGIETSGASGSEGKAGSADVEDTKSAAPKKPALSPARRDVGSHPI